MARTNKIGIDYFPLDVDFFQDEKIQFVSARFGMKGECIVVRLLCKIYRNGYYANWSDDMALLFAKSVGDGCQDSLVKDVVYELVKRGFFDRSIFEEFSILTSRGIQNRYFEAAKRYKSIDIIREFLLVDVSEMDNVDINSINVDINSINVDINPQKKRKRKEIKTKKKLKENSDLEIFENFRKLFGGTKKGLDTEFENFIKKHKDWKNVLPKLLPAVELEIEWRAKRNAAGAFVPQWKNLQTWINQRCWEQEFDFNIGKNERNRHKPPITAGDIGAIVAAGSEFAKD